MTESTPASPTTSYLTNDTLGSPRVITDASGNIQSRRDFLPFGEEIQSGISGRTTAQGYGGQDNIRQKFTGYERDAETDLDFAQARMYNKNHGRFTSSDPLLSSGRVETPQTWNRYAYTLNNPINLVDPDGLYECKSKSAAECTAFRNSLADARAKLTDIETQYGKGSDEYKKAERALTAYGCESVGGNCVDAKGTVLKDASGNAIKDTSGISVSFTYQNDGAVTSLNKDGKSITINFNNYITDGDARNQALIGNEGSNAADAQNLIKTGKETSRY